MEGEILATVCPWMMAMFGEIFYPEQLAGMCVCVCVCTSSIMPSQKPPRPGRRRIITPTREPARTNEDVIFKTDVQ